MTISELASTTIPTTIPTTGVDALRADVTGDVLTSADAGYDAARSGFNLLVDQRPAVIVVAATVQDVATAVEYASAVGLPVAIQATGHGVARPADGAVLIVTRGLNAVTIDPQARTAELGAGALWGEVLGPAQQHGLAPLLGSTTGVSAVGYTLGGGFGWLGRRFGLGSDSVISFDLVTPDGARLTVSDDENPELFWALRGGGGGSLGVVVGMRIHLYPVSTVYAGNLLYPAELARDVLRRWREWAPGTDEQLTSAVTLMNFPPLDVVPEPLRGRSFAIVRGCWSGGIAEGEAVMAHWRDWRPPVLDMFAPMPFTAADMISQDPLDPMPAMVTAEWFDTLEDDAFEILLDATYPEPGTPPTLFMTEIRNAGGAVRRGAAGAANDRGRSGEFLCEMGGLAPSPEGGATLDAHLRATRARLAPYVNGAAYLNFLEGAEKQERTAAAFSEAHRARLAALKTAVDPANRFAHGFAI